MQTNPNQQAQSGIVLLTTILVLALVTVVVFSAMRTSTVEQQIATNEWIHQRAFFLAEAGIAHAVAVLASSFARENAFFTGPGPRWDFAFNAPARTAGTADDVRAAARRTGSCEPGMRWLEVRQPNGSRYTLTVFNNDEEETAGDCDTDGDGLIWLRSDAAGPRGGRASIQVLLHGDAADEHPAGYPAQAGGGAAANNSGSDRDPIFEFDLQVNDGVID